MNESSTKVLIAVPTKNRKAMVEEVLNHELIYYKKYDIDLCYYDSSSDEQTKNIICSLSKEHNCNIGYVKMDDNLCLDNKVLEIIKSFDISKYDYFWLINDSISITEDMLSYVIGLLNDSYDLIRLPLAGAGEYEDYIAEDVNDWFHNCSQGMAHMATTIMSKTLLDMTIDWNYYKNKYIYNNELNDEHGFFFTVGFYLEQIAELKSFKGIFIGNRVKWRRDSPLKKNNIYWKNYVFEAWAKSYPETILKLPECYTEKEKVIKKSDNIRPGRFSKEMLIHYRICGIFDETKFEKYQSYFKYITTESIEECYRISKESIVKLKKDFPNLVSIEEEWEKKLDTIERQIGNRAIYIYGAGLYGEKVIQKLANDGYRASIIKVLVTDTRENMSLLEGIEVCSINHVHISNEDLIIVCAMPSTAKTIKDELNKRNIFNYVALFDF